MIHAIVPVPIRIRPGTVLRGCYTMDSEVAPPSLANCNNVLSGRDIQSPPLAFYKVFSTFGLYRYEHTFVTDELIDPVTLINSVDAYTGHQHKNSALLIPISVKVISKSCTDTFLFSQNINFLLSNYIMGSNINQIRPFSVNRAHYCDRIVINPPNFGGVCGACNYISKMLRAIHTVGHNMYTPDIVCEQFMEYLCPERPEEFSNALTEYIWYENNPDALYGYLDDIFTYETGMQFEPMSLLDRYYYTADLDPITACCLRSPTYINVDQLKPYLGTVEERTGYYRLAQQQACLTENINCANLIIEDSDYTLILDILETLYGLPDSDVNIEISRSGKAHHNLSSTVPFYDLSASLGRFESNLYQAFMNWTTKKYTGDFDYITISKTWLGELVVFCHSQIQPPIRYYLNMNLFHLMTPSLVDRNMYDRCQL